MTIINLFAVWCTALQYFVFVIVAVSGPVHLDLPVFWECALQASEI